MKEGVAVFGRLSLKVSEAMTLYGKLGTAKFENHMDLNTGQSLVEQYEIGLYTGAGGRLKHELMPDLIGALDAQVNWWNCDIEDMTYSGVTVSSVSGHTSTWEFQIAGTLSYRIDYSGLSHPAQGEKAYFTPYVGAKYSYLRMDPSITAESSTSFSIPEERSNDYKFGIVLGADITLPILSNMSFNLECRFLDENAVSGYVFYEF
jgi:hypothetical protein